MTEEFSDVFTEEELEVIGRFLYMFDDADTIGAVKNAYLQEQELRLSEKAAYFESEAQRANNDLAMVREMLGRTEERQ